MRALAEQRRGIGILVPALTAFAAACSSGRPPRALSPVPDAPPPSAPQPEVRGPQGITVPDSLRAKPVHPASAARLDVDVLAVALGEATYYADRFEGRRTASGIVFSNSRMYAAHLRYPFGTIVRVTNLRNNKSVILEVVDRGPYGSDRTIIDVSRRAAEELDMIRAGRVPVRVEVLDWGQNRRVP